MCVCVVLECDKAICLNELGRMMLWYGDRQYSVTFFRKSLDVVLGMMKDQTLMQEKRLEYFHPKLVHTHRRRNPFLIGGAFGLIFVIYLYKFVTMPTNKSCTISEWLKILTVITVM